MSQWIIQDKLHDLGTLDPTSRKGRNPSEGYARGCGIQFGNVRDLCLADSDYKYAINLAAQRSVVSPSNFMNLFLLFKFFLPKIQPGVILEFGSYRGGSAFFMACLAKRLLKNTPVFGLDTFTGMPPANRQIDAHKSGDFADVDLPLLRQVAQQTGLDNLQFIQGPFEQTTPDLLAKVGPVALVHIDCDIYSSVCYAYDAVKPALVPGGYIILDDPLTSSCLGAFEAMEELMIRRDGLHAEQVYPHLVFRYPPL